MSALVRGSSKTVIFNRFLKVATTASNLMNEIYNDGLLSEFSISMLEKNHCTSLRFFIYNYEIKSKLAEKYR